MEERKRTSKPDPKQDRPAIEFFTSDELLTELAKRMNLALFIYVDNKDCVQIFQRGYSVACIGLSRYASQKLYENLVGND